MALVLLSGGMDSTIALRKAIDDFESVIAISFDYGQRQKHELTCAKKVCKKLSIPHEVIKIPFLNKISKGFSANTDTDLKMPTIKDILGLPQPTTYVPNRNMILLSIAASYAEVNTCHSIITGLQVHDEYSYHDTTPKFVRSLNRALMQNRTFPIEIIAPFQILNKTNELQELIKMEGTVELLRDTITCLNPENVGKNKVLSCGECPSCSERIQAFINVGVKDPIDYKRKIIWSNV